MTVIGGAGFEYDASEENFGELPDGWGYREAAGVAVDASDNVYVFNRDEHPVIVYDRNGKFLRSWGEGVFGNPHGIATGPNETIFCIDAGDHTVRKFTQDGKLLMTIGTANKPAGRLSGEPFRNPTHLAVDWATGELYVSDGYSNARVHKYDPNGNHLLSWGQSGTGPGEFNTVHNVATDKDGLVYIADRENHRVQVFTSAGRYITQWGNLAMASCIDIERTGDEIVYVGEFFAGIRENPAGMGNWTGKRLGPRVTIMDKGGNILTRVGDMPIGEAAGQFIAPHGIAVDSHGDVYVAEVSYSVLGGTLEPTREVKTIQKLVRRR
jgi:DNA-binding beta-propeller fold protein YncE